MENGLHLQVSYFKILIQNFGTICGLLATLSILILLPRIVKHIFELGNPPVAEVQIKFPKSANAISFDL